MAGVTRSLLPGTQRLCLDTCEACGNRAPGGETMMSSELSAKQEEEHATPAKWHLRVVCLRILL